MSNLIPFLLIAVVMYFIFFRRGGMGCCGGHDTSHPESRPHRDSQHDWTEIREENIIDLKENEYSIVTTEGEELGRGK